MSLLVVRCIDKVAAEVKVRVEELEAVILAHRAQIFVPFVTDAHRTEANRRYMDTGHRSKLTMPTKPGSRLGCRCEIRHFSVGFQGSYGSESAQ